MDYVDPDRFIKDVAAALRGGDYPQTKGKLRRPDRPFADAGYCCLGVMCDIYDPTRWWAVDSLYYEYWDPESDQEMDTGLPDSILGLLGFGDGANQQELPVPISIIQRHAPEYVKDHNLNRDDDTMYLTSLNDEGCPFPKIADIIEDWWKERKETA